MILDDARVMVQKLWPLASSPASGTMSVRPGAVPVPSGTGIHRAGTGVPPQLTATSASCPGHGERTVQLEAVVSLLLDG